MFYGEMLSGFPSVVEILNSPVIEVNKWKKDQQNIIF